MKKIYESGGYLKIRSFLLKTLIIMKMLVIIICGLSLLSSYGKSYSQNAKLTFDFENTSIEAVLQHIEDRSDYSFMYDNNKIDVARKVSIRVKDEPIGSILDQLFNHEVRYKLIGKHFIITPASVDDQVVNAVSQQQKTVTGKVTDSSGAPLPGVSVVINETTTGTITDADGNYSISNVRPDAILLFSFVGMKIQEIPVVGKSQINVMMEDETIGIEEVVAIGYGTQKKVNITGAVGVASSERLENRPISSVGEGLQGVIPNLNITKADGDPSTGVKFNVRGFTSISGGEPLILVDGVPMSLERVNPGDVKSVSVLKDAAASAIYGARAAFGVILVETKQGKEGKVSVTLSSEYSLSKPIFLMDMVTNPYDYAVARNKAWLRTRGTTKHSEQYLEGVQRWLENPIKENEWGVENGVLQFYGNSNVWEKAITDFAPQQRYDLNISGASEKASYYVSFGFLDKYGYLKRQEKNLEYKRYNVLVKAEFKINDWLSLEEKIAFNSQRSDQPHDYGGDSNLNTLARVGPDLMIQFPDLPYYIEPGDRGKYEQYIGMYMSGGYNFLGYLDGGRTSWTVNDTWLTQGITMTPPVKGLKIRGDFSYNSYYRYYEDVASRVNFVKPTLLNTPMIENLASGNDYVKNQTNYNQYYVFNAYAEYTLDTFEDHYLKAMIGFNQEWGRNSHIDAQAYSLITPAITALDATTGNQQTGGGETHFAMRGMFYRLNYTYKDKYLLEANGRYDGTSRFPKDSRFGFFPSASFGWRISKEPFMKSTHNWLDELKLRVSYGELGNQQVDYYPYMPTMGAGSAGYVMNTGPISYVSAANLVSPNLTWETVVTRNLGLDLIILDKRLDITFDTFIRDTKDMLMNITYPAVLGTSAPKENAADLSTKGWELAVTWRDRVGKDWQYSINIGLSDNQSEITKYENPTGAFDDYYVGKKIGEIWGFETVGIFQYDEDVAVAPKQSKIGAGWRAGDIQYTDLNEDGEISQGSRTLDNPGDLKIIGNSSARYAYGINPEISFKNWELSFFFQGLLKRDFMPETSTHKDFWPFNTDGVEKYYITESWNEDNRDAYFPAIHAAKYDKKNIQPQTRYLQNAAYIRLKNLTLNYNLPRDLVNKLRVKNAQLYFSGQNLWEYTPMHKPLDPEVIDVEQHYYKQRIYALGLKVTL